MENILFNLHFRVDIRRSLLHQNIETVEEVGCSNSVLSMLQTIFKGTVNVISSNSPFTEWHVRLTTIPILFNLGFFIEETWSKTGEIVKVKKCSFRKSTFFSSIRERF